MKGYDDINKRIKEGKAVVLTAEEIIDYVDEHGYDAALQDIDVVTTGTFAPMCSSGVFINFGQTDIPIKIKKTYLNDVEAYSGLASVDAYIGATEESTKLGLKKPYGGADVIVDLVKGKDIKLIAYGKVTDCKPKEKYESIINKNNINECIMFNPRNIYQNYNASTNSSNRDINTYMGKLIANMGNVAYSSAGELSPLINDPDMLAIGIGSNIFIGGAEGYITWEGTQFNPYKEKNKSNVPIGPARTLSVIGNLKEMKAEYLKAIHIYKYGTTLAIGIGVPIPILSKEILKGVCVKDKDIETYILDYGVGKSKRPIIRKITYKELKSGEAVIGGKKVPTHSMSNIKISRKVAQELKKWIEDGKMLINKPIKKLL